VRFKSALITIAIACLIVELGDSKAAAEPVPTTNSAWAFRDGDRVALIGGTFIEREQRYGYLETALTVANPDKTITFRNLGWSGDTVGGVSRSGFDPPEAGFKQLVDQVNAVKPTVIIVGYGANESFAGKAGLDAFTEGLERLIDALKPTKARFIFLAPLKQEDLGRPLPDPSRHNRDVELYSKAVEEFAKRIGAAFVTLDPFSTEVGSTAGERLTDNGVHLTALGYKRLAESLKLAPPPPLKPDQVERLRETIIRKNRLFFHRWRPQNITYLLGFRKHEQGNNAVEIPQFDPLVEEQEKKIGVLKKPVSHVYEPIRDDAKGASK